MNRASRSSIGKERLWRFSISSQATFSFSKAINCLEPIRDLRLGWWLRAERRLAENQQVAVVLPQLLDEMLEGTPSSSSRHS